MNNRQLVQKADRMLRELDELQNDSSIRHCSDNRIDSIAWMQVEIMKNEVMRLRRIAEANARRYARAEISFDEVKRLKQRWM